MGNTMQTAMVDFVMIQVGGEINVVSPHLQGLLNADGVNRINGSFEDLGVADGNVLHLEPEHGY
jgi:hypothetical protein